MRPEAQTYLDKARQSLAHARAILKIELGDEAGRAKASRSALRLLPNHQKPSIVA